MSDLSNKMIVVTGASQGIGRAIALACAQNGAGIIINYRHHKSQALELAQLISSQYQVPAHPLCFDVTDSVAVNNAIQSLESDGITIDGWVNNAGINLPGLLLTQTEQMIQQQIATNIMGPINCCKAIIPHMMQRRQGVIVNIGSITSHFVSPGQSIYAATKGALVSFTKALAKEYGRKGIRVVCVEPGPIDTQMFKMTKTLKGDEIQQRVALSRLGDPREVGDAVAYLLSDTASFISGGVLTVDGGYSLG